MSGELAEENLSSDLEASLCGVNGLNHGKHKQLKTLKCVLDGCWLYNIW